MCRLNRVGTLASGIPASTGSRNPIFWIEVVGGTLDPKNWTKNWRLPGNPIVGGARWAGLRTKGWIILSILRNSSIGGLR